MKNYLLIGTLFSSVAVFSQVGIQTQTPQATLDVVGVPGDTSKLDGIIAPRLTGDELRAKTYTVSQTGALVYVTAADTAPAGQTVNVTTAGYYYFDGTLWQKTGGEAASVNIYNANGSLTSARTLTNNGFNLTFLGSNQRTTFPGTGGIRQYGTAGMKRADIVLTANDNNGDSVISDLQIFQDPENTGQIIVSNDSRGLTLGSRFTTQSAPIKFETGAGSGANGTEKMRITGEGNIGMNTSSPTEKMDNNGITRLRNLPVNGATNAINTNTAGNASATQNQTFTATRTVVADANGVLGYVAGLPIAGPGTSKIVVSAGVLGTQNIGNSNQVLALYPNEYIDTNNSWTNNVFTVPAGLGGLYIFNMQSSHSHDVNSQTNWFTMSILQKSTDGGSTWSIIMRDTRSGLAGSDVDNGNTINWTGNLNGGDRLRLLYHCNSTASNYVQLGSITITQLAQ
ncbi:autotransporter outer membrane beta-barrel domain-containing protein [Chryseobacterium populi]|uniref:Uncharacterized protein n=1 Tax=Chryseobacterium populi TaxID=1144316 RepID=J2KAV2_9FLAO|nr:hypothetical protein [Chryseobacterium populi]EJL70313.1 hypothetical protein PMI13_02855 [Chryseobacterium populi]